MGSWINSSFCTVLHIKVFKHRALQYQGCACLESRSIAIKVLFKLRLQRQKHLPGERGAERMVWGRVQYMRERPLSCGSKKLTLHGMDSMYGKWV